MLESMISRTFVSCASSRSWARNFSALGTAQYHASAKIYTLIAKFHDGRSRAISTSVVWFSSSQNRDGSFFGLAGSYIKNIRWNSAEEKASKLPDSEKYLPLEKIEEVPLNDDHDENLKMTLDGRYQQSVEELIAEARAKETERMSAVFEEEMGRREAEIERAVRKRLESDLEIQRRQIAFAKWKEDLEREKQRLQVLTESEAAHATNTAAAETLVEHPILGPLLCDLGHKRVHITTIERLASLPVWEKQRFFRHDRAKKMAKDKAKTFHTGLPGIIGIYERKDGSLEIIDGQHRIGMLKILSESKTSSNSNFDFERILVEVYSQPEGNDGINYATDIFREINKAQPANLIDLPGAVKAEELEIINKGVEMIHRRYSDMFSTSEKCQRPHLNIDNVRNELHLNQIIKRYGIKSPDEMAEWIEERNQELLAKYSDHEAQARIPKRAMEKARANNFYLGLDRSWYDE